MYVKNYVIFLFFRIAHRANIVPVPRRLKGSILRQKSKYDDDENKENRTGPRLKFNDVIETREYIRDNLHQPMRKTSSTSGMTRHPLPEFKSSSSKGLILFEINEHVLIK